MDQTYETMYHTYDWPAFCLYQPKTPAGNFSELIGPGKDQSVKVWSASSCELVWDPHDITERADWRLGWIWDSMGTTTPAIFFGVTPRNGIVIDLLIEEYGLPGPRLGLVFVRFLSLSHGGKWFERSDRPRTGRRLNGPPSTLTMWGVMVVSLSPNFPKFTVNDSFK